MSEENKADQVQIVTVANCYCLQDKISTEIQSQELALTSRWHKSGRIQPQQTQAVTKASRQEQDRGSCGTGHEWLRWDAISQATQGVCKKVVLAQVLMRNMKPSQRSRKQALTRMQLAAWHPDTACPLLQRGKGLPQWLLPCDPISFQLNSQKALTIC